MLTIGDLSKATGVKVPTIRYYEQMGLIYPAERSEGNQRRYSSEERERLAFIRHARDLGQPARDEPRARVVTEAEAVAGARGDRDDVLERAAHLDADRIVARVHAEPVGREPMLDGARDGLIVSPGRDWFPGDPDGAYLRLTFAGAPPDRLLRGAVALAGIIAAAA